MKFFRCWLLLFYSTIYCFLTSSLIFPWDIARLTLRGIYPFWSFSPAHCRMICYTFIWTFLGFSFYRECYGFDWASSTYRLLSSCTPSLYFATFVTQMIAGSPHPGSSSLLALKELFFPTGKWFWAIDFIVTRPMFYHVTIEPRSIE